MRKIASLLLAALCAVGLPGPATAQFATSPADQDALSQRGDSKAPTGQGDVAVLLAIVTKIDRSKNLVALETEVGPIEVFATPEVLKELQEGDVITVALEEEEMSPWEFT